MQRINFRPRALSGLEIDDFGEDTVTGKFKVNHEGKN
jgi:hypothetical protein